MPTYNSHIKYLGRGSPTGSAYGATMKQASHRNLKLRKCHFGTTKCIYLGPRDWWSQEERCTWRRCRGEVPSADEEGMIIYLGPRDWWRGAPGGSSLEKFPQPMTMQERETVSHSWASQAMYYRKFMPRLLPRCPTSPRSTVHAALKLKALLRSRPVLVSPDFRTCMQTDA